MFEYFDFRSSITNNKRQNKIQSDNLMQARSPLIQNRLREIIYNQYIITNHYDQFQNKLEAINLISENNLYIRQLFFKRWLKYQEPQNNQFDRIISSDYKDASQNQFGKLQLHIRFNKKRKQNQYKYHLYRLKVIKQSDDGIYFLKLEGIIDQQTKQLIYQYFQKCVNQIQKNNLLIQQLWSHKLIHEIHEINENINQIKLLFKALKVYNLKKYAQTLQLLKKQYKNYDVLFLKAKSHYKIEQFQSSIQIYNQLEEMTKKDEVVFYQKGKALFEVQSTKEAKKLFLTIIQINDQYYKAYEKLGIIYHQKQSGNALQAQGKLDEAIKMYDRAIEINPNDVSLINKGNALQEQGKLDEAIQMFDHAIKINPNIAYTYFNKGNALQAQGKLDEAILMYDRAIEINPNDALSYSNKAYLFYHREKYNDAYLMLEKAISLDPNNPVYNFKNIKE